jgi:hypothetical protein
MFTWKDAVLLTVHILKWLCPLDTQAVTSELLSQVKYESNCDLLSAKVKYNFKSN